MTPANKDKETVIEISGVKKQYKLGQIGGTTLTASLQSWWAKKHGKEDPNTMIGQETRLVGQSFMALNGIDLTIYEGEAVGIIGSNGAGKSTLLKLLSRVTAPTEGTIKLYGRVASMLEVGTGFHGEMTGRENIYLNGAILGMSKAEIDAKIEKIIDFSEVRDFIDTPVKRYSSGMYVKLAFSVAAHLDSEIMIMDEVLAVGDMAFQKKCLAKMREVATKEGRTVLYVSHNMNTIRQLCSRCIVLNQGKVIFEGDVEKAIQIYLGSTMQSKSVVRLDNIKRDREFLTDIVTMKTLTALDGKDSIYKVGSKARFRLDYYIYKHVKNTFFRVIIKTGDGAPVTMATNQNGFEAGLQKEETIEFELDISRLVPGPYTLNLIFYELNSLGVETWLDGLGEIYNFEISQTLGFNNNMAWQTRYWGDVYSAPLNVTRI